MLSFISSNISTISICIALAAIVALIVIKLVKDKKRGKSTCGGNCGHCPMGGSCHNK